MSNYQTQFGNTYFQSAADADLLLRIGIALAACQRAAWRVVRVGAQNGVVRLEGIVPTFYDRQLILSVARHVAGVLRVEDELAIDEPTPGRTNTKAEDSSSLADRADGAHQRDGADPGSSEVKPAPNAFYHLPVVSESLEDILAARAEIVSATR